MHPDAMLALATNTRQQLQELTVTPPAATSVMTTEKTRFNQASCLLFLSSGCNRLANSRSNANTMPYTVLWCYYMKNIMEKRPIEIGRYDIRTVQ